MSLPTQAVIRLAGWCEPSASEATSGSRMQPLDPDLIDHHSIALIVARLSFAQAAISRRSLIISAERPPWIVRPGEDATLASY
jgi:hypothetical protein